MKKLITIATALVAIIPLTGSPAPAATAGALAFTCTAQLPHFPSDGDAGTCGGTASVAGGAGVTTDVGTYVITGAGSFNATFEYSEGCVGGPPLTGTANGTAEVDGLTAVAPDGTTTTASGELTFNWTRSGLVAVISITGGSLTVEGGGSVALSGDTAEAVFVPVLTADNLCPTGGPLTAQVAGSAQIF